MQNDPEPMTDKFIHMLSWEGATDRLFQAAGLTTNDFKELENEGREKVRTKAAQFHVGNARKSHFVSELFSGRMLKRTLTPTPSNETKPAK